MGIGLLSYLSHLGIALSIALLVVMIVGFSLYIAQVRFFVGSVDLLTIGKTFVVVYILNRTLLWGIHENWGLAIYYAQFISIALLTTGSFIFLKRRRNTLKQTKKAINPKNKY